MTKTTRVFVLFILSATLISCGVSTSPTPRPLVTTALTQSVTPTTGITPSPVNNPVCVASTSSTVTNGWDCVNERYGFVLHFPSTARIALTQNDNVQVWLESSLTNPRISRLIEIFLGEKAESCFSDNADEMQIGERDFVVDHGFEPSGVVYAWRSYAIANDSKSVCFVFVVGFETWEQDDPLFPPEEDQGLDEVVDILATFRWLVP